MSAPARGGRGPGRPAYDRDLVGAALDVIEYGAERVRAGSWRGRAGVAYLAPVPGAPAPSSGFVQRCLTTLRERGFAEVVTGALAPPEQRGFLAAGFEVREHLVLLARDLDELPTGPAPRAVRLRPGRRWERAAVLAVDRAAFRDFWQLDDAGLDEALHATPRARFRVAVTDGAIAGYAVTGRAGRHGYLQRLAVDPAHHRAGIGRALVLDGLRWLRRRGVTGVVVNTQPDNEAALALYRSLGFRLQPGGLDVLGRRLP